MEPTPKPSGFGKSVPEARNNHHLHGLKPGPPTHLHYEPEARSSKEKEDTNTGTNNVTADLHDCSIIERCKEDTTNTDFGIRDVFNIVKSLDVNRYATKKTIAQGMLDIALLTANASQLKYILQVGKQHEFYTLMLTLICTSIALQAIVGILFVIVGGLDINRRRDHRAAEIINDAILIGVFIISLMNVVISGFGMESRTKPQEFLAFRRDVGIICVLLGSTFNINKAQDQPRANVWNNISLALMVLTVAVNVIISAFDMKDTDSPAKTVNLDDHDRAMLTTGIR